MAENVEEILAAQDTARRSLLDTIAIICVTVFVVVNIFIRKDKKRIAVDSESGCQQAATDRDLEDLATLDQNEEKGTLVYAFS
ncbi:hypothetical protein BsWGS_25139 [Bradybaena similaris]